MNGTNIKLRKMELILNDRPDVVVVDISSLDRWKYLLNINNETMFKEIIEYLLLSYPYNRYTDGLWYIMDSHMDMYSVDPIVLEELGVRFDELSLDMDRLIQWYLGKYFHKYKFLTMLEPHGAVFKFEN